MMHTNDQVLFHGSNGQGVLLLHGVSSGAAQMVPLGKFLNDCGYTVHCCNIAGHGTYPQELLRTSFEDMIDKAEYDFDQMRRHFDKVYVGGLSMGGCLSLALASKRENVAGVISVSSPQHMLPGNAFTAEYPEGQEFFHRDLGGKVGIAQYYHIHYEDIAIRVCKELRNLSEYLAEPGRLERITCPAFIAQAQDDEAADPESCHKIYNRIGSEIKTLYNPVTGGHNLTFNEGRFGLMQAISDFLKPL